MSETTITCSKCGSARQGNGTAFDICECYYKKTRAHKVINSTPSPSGPFMCNSNDYEQEAHRLRAKVRELKGLLTRYAAHVDYHEGVNFLSDVYQNGNGNCLSDDQRYAIQELLKEGASDE